MSASGDRPIRHIAVIGGGVIGASWAAFYLARGFDVSVTDPADGAEARLRRDIDRAWPALEALGIAAGADRSRLRFHAALEPAVASTDLVQECGPEREDAKIALFHQLDALTAPDVLLISSSSGLRMSTLQRDCRWPGRSLIGHPFNPPHLIPLVELVGGARTDPAALDRADRFYSGLGKRTIRVKKEVPGHVANRLQAALWREAVHLVAEGVVSVEDVDTAVCRGPGLRWALMGPNLTFHLGGGVGGLGHFLHHLAGPVSNWWADLGRPELTPEIRELLIEGVHAAMQGRTAEELARWRDERLLRVLAATEQQPASLRP